MSRNLTPGQTAAALGVSASTLRRWSGEFGQHLGPSARPAAGRRRAYTPDDLGTLRRAADLLRAGKSPVEVAGLLSLQAAPAESSAAEVIGLPAVVGELQAARELVRSLVDRVDRAEHHGAELAYQLEQASEALAASRDELAGVRSQVDELAGRLQAIEAERAAERSRSWLDRLLGRRPG